MKKKINNEQQHQEISPFVEGVIKWFQALMDKYTHGKYSSSEEIAFFSDESNLYDENGVLKPEYENKIKEYEHYIVENDVNKFLKDTHSVDSDEFGDAYDEYEIQMLDSACSFIDDQENIVRKLQSEKEKVFFEEKEFDFDKWFEEYAKQHNISPEDIEKAKQNFAEQIDEILKEDEELRQFVKNSFNTDITKFINN